MARFAYECTSDMKSNNTNEPSGTIRSFPCKADNFCLYCCCEPQCCFLLQKNPPKYFWEAWYFWLGVALLILFLISSVSSYIISNCRQNIRILTGQGSAGNNNRSSENNNEISIHVIPTTGVHPSHRKLHLCTPSSGASLMTPIVA